MLDEHYYPNNWGVRPVLFHFGSLDVQSYPFFVLLGLVVGIAIYYFEAKKQRCLSENGFFLAFGSIAGGIIGAKLLDWSANYRFIIAHIHDLQFLFSGRTIIGGLIGGATGAVVTKKILGIKEKRGNLFAPAVAMGVAIGRLGCFFRGCCYGKPTALPWGVDFGDRILRHPTQLYESLFMLVMFAVLQKVKGGEDIKPGQLFKFLMISYFIFRFFVEFIRVEPSAFWGLTFFQIVTFTALTYLVRDDIKYLIIKLKHYATA
ncbi:prolipoprotein diacylglyceryl transferase [Candidatus Falkowbacteria bacterium]|nr:prolipoprotein diacylglyceryl transferase [Candidatus Falkowbacteria bacterium]